MVEIGFLSRVTRDITDGLMVLNLRGEIVFVNECISGLLKTGEIRLGAKYAEVMMTGDSGQNDAFHQFLLDAVYDKSIVHKGNLSYRCPDGTDKIFHVTTSFLFGEDGSTKEGVVIQISDITVIAAFREKVNDSAKVFVVLMTALCLWVISCSIWEALGRPISDTAMTKMVEVFGIVLFHYLLTHTSITLKDMGLGTKNIGRALLVDGSMAVLCLLILGLIKLFLIKAGRFSADEPFLRFDRFGPGSWIYPITVVVQEFLTRGVVQESIRRIIPGKYSMALSIITSSLFFAALHIHKGIVFMAGAFLLLSIFGIIYRKQKTIWGLCIPHLLLGWALTLLFGV